MAPNKQTSSTRQAKADIESAASEAVKVIANAASEAARVVATATATAIKVVDTKNSGDHDLLVVLNSKMEDLKADIKDIKDGTTVQLADHETRIRAVEKGSEDFVNIKKIVYGGVALILTSVLGALVYLVVHQ